MTNHTGLACIVCTKTLNGNARFTRGSIEFRDLVQDALLKAYRVVQNQTGSYDPAKGTLTTYLGHAMRTAIADSLYVELRKSGRFQASNSEVEYAKKIDRSEPTPDYIPHLQAEEVWEYIEALPKRDIKIMKERFVYGLSNADIARNHRRTRQATSISVRRILDKIRKHFKQGRGEV